MGTASHMPTCDTNFSTVVDLNWSERKAIAGHRYRANTPLKFSSPILNFTQVKRALIVQSAMVYCASKLMEISRVFWIII